MPLTIRRLGPHDTAAVHEASVALGAEAFGVYPAHLPRPPMPEPGSWPDGVGMWAAFDPDDPETDGAPRMAGRVRTHDYTSWWAGVAVPTVGYAGVAVPMEYRGRGLLADLFRASLSDHLAHGASLAALYPTAPGIYRGLGFEIVTTYEQVELPAGSLAGVRPAPAVTLRRARESDLPGLIAAYDAWAGEQNGPLTRKGPLFDPSRILTDATGVTLAEVDEGGGRAVVGYALWERGSGYGADKVLEVHDLVALRPDAARALWRGIGSFSSVTGKVRLWTSHPDTTQLVLPGLPWDQVARHPYMLRVVDLPGAVSARPFATDGTATVRVTGDVLDLVTGVWRVSITDGAAEVERVDRAGAAGDDVPELTVQGLSLLYAGTLSTANLRLAGHLSGPGSSDALLDAWFGGRQVHVRDYF